MNIKQFVFFQSTAEDEQNSFFGELQQNSTQTEANESSSFTPGVYGIHSDGSFYQIARENCGSQVIIDNRMQVQAATPIS